MAALGLLALSTDAGVAQDRSRLVEVLNSGADFRVRVQAAFALGNSRDAGAIPGLERALRDSNPAVRAAAATALGRIGSPRALPVLRRARRDSSAAVRMQVDRSIRLLEESSNASANEPSGPARARGSVPGLEFVPSEDRVVWSRVRYVVMLGEMRNRSAFQRDRLSDLLRREVAQSMRLVRGVAVLQREDDRARREIQRRRLPKLRMEGSLTKVERQRRGRDLSVRCEVSIMLLDDRARAIRGELRGAATGTEPRRRQNDQEVRLAEQALSGAVRSALSNAQQAIAQAARR
jgi:hypothetical protein